MAAGKMAPVAINPTKVPLVMATASCPPRPSPNSSDDGPAARACSAGHLGGHSKLPPDPAGGARRAPVRSGRMGLPLELAAELLAEGRQVVRVTAGDEDIRSGRADLYLFVDPLPARVADVGLQARP
jgi:hypothetical protein